MSQFVNYPQPGSIYRHFKGGKYRVMTLADDADYEGRKVVVYRSILFGGVYVKTLEYFFQEVQEAGGMPRFRLIANKGDGA
jgi:hypothetical protein